MTEQQLEKNINDLKIEEKIEWAVNTIRDKETFGLDQLNASLARERRAKGVLIDCRKEIQKIKQQLEEAVSVIEKAKFSSGFFIDDHNSKDTYLSASEFLAKYRAEDEL